MIFLFISNLSSSNWRVGLAAISSSYFFWNAETMSIGIGKIIVEFFSDDIEFSVWKS